MPFIKLDDFESVEIAPGARIRAPFGKNVMLSYVEMEADCLIPEHAHPHEQAAIIVSGKVQMTIDGETRLMEPGDMFIIPGGVTHGSLTVGGPAVMLDVFSPVREDYAALFNKWVPPVE